MSRHKVAIIKYLKFGSYIETEVNKRLMQRVTKNFKLLIFLNLLQIFNFYMCQYRRYVTNLKVAGSRPDEVNDFYQVT
jgi:hypothetical protein